MTSQIKDFINLWLLRKYSPEQIVGKAKRESLPCVSVERIYQYIWTDKKQGGKLYENLRTRGKRYQNRGSQKNKRGSIKDRVDISQRPAIVDERKRFGDLEIDTIIGKAHKGAILTINDRASGMLKMKKLNGKNAEELAKETNLILHEWQPLLHTITADNGKEFAAHQAISATLKIDFYFAQPYHSWERGSNENLNGLIRQYIPKQTDFTTISDQYIEYVEYELNERPRKRHNYQAPIQIFNQLIKQNQLHL